MVNTQHIRIGPKIKKALDKLKLVESETYCSVIERLIEKYEIIKR